MEPLSAGEPSSFGHKRLKGRYEIGAILGHGSLGTTYRAHDRLLERPVAVKVLADRYADDAVFRERFMAATAAAGRLIHPNIVTVLDAGIVDGRPFVVMELVEGPSLRARLSRGAVPIADCQRLSVQLADALSTAHRQRIIHGDIRPENVLIDEHGNAKLSDFGFVRAAVATDVTLLGTVQRAAYNPPEHAIRDTSDERVDVYSLAVVLYEMLTGSTPRQGVDGRTRARLAQVAPTPVRRHRPDVPPHLDRALWKALEPDPHQRIGTADELRAALSDRNALAASAPTAPVLPAATWRSEPRQRRRSGPGAGGLFSALIPFLATLALIGVAIGGITIFIPRLFSGFQLTDVPPLTGHTMSEAAAIAEASGLQVKVTSSTPTDDQPKTTVLSQDPAADKRVRRGSEVRVTVSAGIRPPSVVGKPIEEARATLVRAGWTVADVQTKPDAQGAAGTVVAMKPGPDEPADDRKQGITLYTAGGNLAAGRPVRLDGGQPGPVEMTDGNAETAGFLVKGPPTWVEVDLAQPATVAGVELVTAQEKPGITIHEVWITTTDGQFKGMNTFVGPTADNQTLAVHFDAPVANVKTVRIATTQVAAGGRIGWREIRLFDH